MNKEIDYFIKGKEDARAYYSSQALAGFTKYIKPEDAIRIYWPPVEESMMMVSSPLPKPRQKWIAGFRKEQLIILAVRAYTCKVATQVHTCKTCGTQIKQEIPDESNKTTNTDESK